MYNQLVTHLSEKVMQTLLENPGKKTKSIMQLVDIQQKSVNGRALVTAQLSDGFFSDNFIVFPNIQDNFVQLARPKDVLEVGLVRKEQSSTFTLLYEFRVVYSDVAQLIGNPTPFKLGAENPRGAGVIPDEVIFGRPNENSRPGARPPVGKLDEEQPVYNEVYRIESDNEEALDHFTEIANLNHYDRSFKIRGRITKKTALKPFKKKDGTDGAVFNIIIKDESRAIQATFFNDMAHKYHPQLEEGQIYSISDAEIKNAGRFNGTDNKFELSVHERTEIRRLPDIKEIAAFHFNFVKIGDIENKNENDSFDVIAIVEDEGVVKELQLRTGEMKEKRTIKLRDDTGYAIELTIWGRPATEAPPRRNSIVIFQEVRVKVFQGGKTLSIGPNSTVLTKIPESARYKELLLFKNSAKNTADGLKNLAEGAGGPHKGAPFIKVSQMNREAEGLMAEPEGPRLYFSVIAHLSRFLGNVYYESCENENCHKKVTRNQKGLYECANCRKTFEQPKYRFMATVKFSDDSGNFLTMATGEEACQMIFKRSVEDLVALKLRDERGFLEFMRECLFEEYRVRVSARKEVYNGEGRVKFQLYKLQTVMADPEYLLTAIQNKLTE